MKPSSMLVSSTEHNILVKNVVQSTERILSRDIHCIEFIKFIRIKWFKTYKR